MSHLLRYLFRQNCWLLATTDEEEPFLVTILVPQGKLILNQSLQWFDPEIVSNREATADFSNKQAEAGVGKEL